MTLYEMNVLIFDPASVSQLLRSTSSPNDLPPIIGCLNACPSEARPERDLVCPRRVGSLRP